MPSLEMHSIKTKASGYLRTREFGLLLLILVITLVVSWIDARFVAKNNLIDILTRSAPTAIIACGVMLVVVTAEIDISVGSLTALLAAAMGIFLSESLWAWPVWQGVLLTLAIGTSVGFCTGCLVAFGKVPSIVVTLGLLTALRGITTLIMQGENIDGLPKSLTSLAKQGIGGIPIAIWTAAVVIAMTAILIHWTPMGRRLYALGSDAYSAKMVGLSGDRLKLFAFAYTGFLTAVATIVDVPRLPKIESGIGMELELLVVTCVVVGGVSISGGRGSVTGVVLAVLLMTMLRPVLTFLDIGEQGEKWTKAIQGLFIMLAVVSDKLFSDRSHWGDD